MAVSQEALRLSLRVHTVLHAGDVGEEATNLQITDVLIAATRLARNLAAYHPDVIRCYPQGCDCPQCSLVRAVEAFGLVEGPKGGERGESPSHT